MPKGKASRHPVLEGYPVWVRSLYILKALGIDFDINVLEGRGKTTEPTLDEMFSLDVLNLLHNHSRLHIHQIVEKLSRSSSNAAVLNIMESLVAAELVKSQPLSGTGKIFRSKTNQARPKANQPRTYWITESGVAQLATWNAQGWGETVGQAPVADPTGDIAPHPSERNSI